MRLLKKYPNRRIYDTQTSQFVALAEIRQMIMDRESIQVLHSKTGADLTRSVLMQIITEMEAEGRERLSNWFDGEINSLRSADMRYGEQIFEIDVPLDGIDFTSTDLLERIKAAFEARHEALYTYSLKDQDPVLINARVATIGAMPALPQEPLAATGEASPASDSRRIYLGEWLDVPVHDFDRLAAGQQVAGPALVVSETTNVLLRPGDQAVTTPHGWLDIEVKT